MYHVDARHTQTFFIVSFVKSNKWPNNCMIPQKSKPGTMKIIEHVNVNGDIRDIRGPQVLLNKGLYSEAPP